MQPNEIIREYLLSELIEEETLREHNRNVVNKAIQEEQQRILAEISQDPKIEEIRKNYLHEFWEETYRIHGENALVEMRPPNVDKAVKNLEEKLERVLQCTILECMECEMMLAEQLQGSTAREHTEEANNQDEEVEEFNQNNENIEKNENVVEEGYKPREATSEYGQSQNQSEEHYHTSDHQEISRRESGVPQDEENNNGEHENELEYEEEQHKQENEQEYEQELEHEHEEESQRPSQAIEEERPVKESSQSPERRIRPTYIPVTPPGQYFYPRYINKREKMEMLIKQPIYVHTQAEVTSPISEKKIQEYQFNKKIQDANFTLEPMSNIPEERGIKVTEEQAFIEDFDSEDVPRKLKVSMVSVAPDIDEAGYPEPWYNKTKSEGNKTATMNKSNISKNYPLENLYDEKSFIKKNIDNYQTFEQEDANFFAQNVFSDLNVKQGYENDVILERLKQRYEAAYREKFLLDRAEMRHMEKNKRRPVNLPDTEFLSDEQIKASKLLSTLKSPENANDLRQLEEQGLSESFQEFKALNSGRKIPQSAKVEYMEAYRASKTKSRGTSPEKKNISIFELFEREIFELASSEVRNLYPGLRHANELSSASTHKSFFFSRPRRYQDIGMVEDFIIDLYRTVSTNNGAVPPKYQHKLQEILNLKPTANKYYEIRRNAKETTERDDNGDDQTSELNLIKDALVITGQELTNRTIDALKPNPENKMRTLLWKCVMALQANFDQSINLVNHHVVGKYDKVVQYVSQPGKVLLQIRTLPKRLKKEEIKKTLYDDFFNFFGELEDELLKGRLDDENEKLLLKYVYFIKRLVQTLEREERLSVINNAEQRINTNQKMNQKLLENKERRRVDTGEMRSPVSNISHPSQEMYGINFAKWEDSLKAIEKENKLLVKYGEEKKRKEEKAKKLEEKKKMKEEELKDYEEYSQRSKAAKQEKEEIRKQEIAFKRQAIAERINALKQQKDLVKTVQKGQLEENIQKTIQEIQHKNELKERAKEEIKEVQKERKEKLENIKKQKMEEKQVSAKSEKEEFAWKKAQELFEKQRRLLQERDRLSQQLKNSAK